MLRGRTSQSLLSLAGAPQDEVGAGAPQAGGVGAHDLGTGQTLGGMGGQVFCFGPAPAPAPQAPSFDDEGQLKVVKLAPQEGLGGGGPQGLAGGAGQVVGMGVLQPPARSVHFSMRGGRVP
jgi:hypothetical protein